IDRAVELIGLTTVLAAVPGGEASGAFAIPLDDGYKRVIGVLKRGEEVEYGFLGVGLYSHMPLGKSGGIPIEKTVTASPAAAAGLQPNDEIISINGRPLKDYNDLFLAISITLVGKEARLEIIRGQGAPRTIRVTVDKSFVPGKVIAARKPAAVFGLRVDYLSVLLQSLDPASHPNVSHGVIIREVQSDSSAAKAFLKVN